jgi:hypothetical protein
MPITDARKLGSTWEWLNNVGNTSEGKEFYEEGLPLLPDIRSSEMYAEAVPQVTPTLAVGETSGVVKRVRMALTLDNSVPNRQAWVAVEPWASGWSSGSYDINTIMNRWLSKKDGPGYLPKFFGGTNGATEIPPLDNSSPVFYPRSGILTFGTARAETGTSPASSIWIEGYIYVGKMQNELTIPDVDIGEPVNVYLAARDAP